jgi:hypothetical protein
MNTTHWFRHATYLSLLTLFAALMVATTASAMVSARMPGKPCGSVGGTSWKFQGRAAPSTTSARCRRDRAQSR